jgi:hypothetical protein
MEETRIAYRILVGRPVGNGNFTESRWQATRCTPEKYMELRGGEVALTGSGSYPVAVFGINYRRVRFLPSVS